MSSIIRPSGSCRKLKLPQKKSRTIFEQRSQVSQRMCPADFGGEQLSCGRYKAEEYCAEVCAYDIDPRLRFVIFLEKEFSGIGRSYVTLIYRRAGNALSNQH
jgi:hypothetical protein